MINKVDVLMPSSSRYGVLHHFAEKLYEAFVRTGLTCRLLNGDDRYLIPMQSKPDFTIGFNGGLQTEKDRFLADAIQVPHVSCLVDPPFRFLNVIPTSHIIVTCDDRSGCDFLHSLNFSRTVFLPHAVEAELSYDPHQKRIYDITILANFFDCEQRKQAWREELPKEIWQAMEKAIEITLNDDKTPLILAAQQTLEPFLQTHASLFNTHPELYYLLFCEIEIYVKGKDRLDLIESLPDCQIHIFGDHTDQAEWSRLFKNRSNIISHPAISFTESLEVMKQSKIVLNSSIKNKAGAHERIFSAAACGAVCVTNENDYLKEQFKNEQNIVFYSRQELGKIQQIVNALLSDEDRRLEVAKGGRDVVMAHHTWDHRVQHLLKVLPFIIDQINKGE